MKTSVYSALAAALGLAMLTTPALALSLGTDNEFELNEIDTGEDGIPDEFEVLASGVVDIGNDGTPNPLNFDHFFFGVFDFETGDALAGDFLILSPLEQIYLAGDLVGGFISYVPADLEDGPPVLVPQDVVIGGPVALDGFLVFDNLFSDLIDPALFEDEFGQVVASVSGGSFIDGPVAFNTTTATFFGQAFIDYGEENGGPPSSEIPLPAALPMLALGIGVLGWTRSRRGKAA